ncbi:MAG: pilus assembly protein TadG-related protein [Acidimicrobiales bacterium]|nr:pilus assembly protein TadG-related protein [Acidimicrobiales bacterium]
MSVHRHERGQVTPLWAIVLVLAGLALVPLGLVARAAFERSEAQNAADAVALAGALDGEDAARSLARRNDARLVGYEEFDGGVEVTVVVGDRRATARAERETVRVPPDIGTLGS